jgi:hypothetical protein
MTDKFIWWESKTVWLSIAVLLAVLVAWTTTVVTDKEALIMMFLALQTLFLRLGIAKVNK